METHFLGKTRCYLAGPMENDRQGENWRNDLMKELADTGIVFFSPYQRPFLNDTPEDDAARKEFADWMARGDYDLAQNQATKIRSHDLRICDLSDFIIARVDPTIATWGTVEEIVTSVRMKKPILMCMVGGKSKTPLWLMGMFPHHYIYDSMEQIVQMVRAIDSGVVKLSSDRWKLLKPEYR